MSEPPALSVVIPALNAEAHLGDQLDALAAQTFAGRFEVIVADNGSTDATVRIVEAHRLARDGVARVVEARGRTGVNAARNAGAAVAAAPVVCCTDADDVVAPGWLASFAVAFAGRTHQRVVASGLIDPRPLAPERFARVQPWSGGHPTTAGGVPWSYGTSMAFSQAAWHDLGGFDESYTGGGDEIEFFVRAHRRGHVHVIASDAVVHYRSRTTRSARFRQMRLRGAGNRRLAEDFPEEVAGAGRCPPLRSRSVVCSTAARFRDEPFGVALQLGLDQMALHLGELDHHRSRSR